MLKQHYQVFVGLLCVIDAAVVLLASYAAWGVRRLTIEGFWPVSWENYIKEPLACFSVPIALYAIWLVKLYRPRRDRSLINEQVQILKASATAIGGLVVALWFVGNDLVGNAGAYGSARVGPWTFDPGHVQIGSLAILLPVMLVVERSLFRLALRWLRRHGRNLRHVAVVGVGRLGQVACRTLERNSWTGLHVAYFVSHHDRTSRVECLRRPVFGGLDQLEETLRLRPVDAVYLAMPNSRAAELPAVLLTLEKFAVDVRIVPDVLPRLTPAGMISADLDGMPILRYRESPFSGFGAAAKRVLDIVGSGAGLLLFSPVMFAIGVLVRLSGPGPVIFKQKRVSLGGRVFKIYKFRTMYHVEDEQGPARWTDRDDPRVTTIGRWLRAASLDELPQLLNVFKGQMSLVGPRPERPELIERFREDWRGYMLRQHVKAGMTGWAQVNGLRGNTSLRKRLQYDLYYIRNWSLGLDLRILWLTLFRGFVHRNAH